MWRTILVPLDGSTFSEHAIPVALQLAKRSHATVELVRVHAPLFAVTSPSEALVPIYDPAWEEETIASERKWLFDTAAKAGAGSGVPVTPVLLSGGVTTALQQRAHAVKADLIVMSTHGRGGLSRAWIGSTADGLVRSAACPILLVRPDRVPGIPAGLGEGTAHGIAVLLDGSTFAEQVLTPATELAQLLGAELTLVRVVTPVTVDIAPPALPIALAANEEVSRLVSDAQRQLEVTATRLRMRGLQVKTVVLAHPSPARALLDWVGEARPTLVAMSTHARTGLGRLLIGSVADKVLRAADVPVLVMRPSGAAPIGAPEPLRAPEPATAGV